MRWKENPGLQQPAAIDGAMWPSVYRQTYVRTESDTLQKREEHVCIRAVMSFRGGQQSVHRPLVGHSSFQRTQSFDEHHVRARAADRTLLLARLGGVSILVVTLDWCALVGQGLFVVTMIRARTNRNHPR